MGRRDFDTARVGMGRRRAESLTTVTPICALVAFGLSTIGDVYARSISLDVDWRYVKSEWVFFAVSRPLATTTAGSCMWLSLFKDLFMFFACKR